MTATDPDAPRKSVRGLWMGALLVAWAMGGWAIRWDTFERGVIRPLRWERAWRLDDWGRFAMSALIPFAAVALISGGLWHLWKSWRGEWAPLWCRIAMAVLAVPFALAYVHTRHVKMFVDMPTGPALLVAFAVPFTLTIVGIVLLFRGRPRLPHEIDPPA